MQSSGNAPRPVHLEISQSMGIDSIGGQCRRHPNLRMRFESSIYRRSIWSSLRTGHQTSFETFEINLAADFGRYGACEVGL